MTTKRALRKQIKATRSGIATPAWPAPRQGHAGQETPYTAYGVAPKIPRKRHKVTGAQVKVTDNLGQPYLVYGVAVARFWIDAPGESQLFTHMQGMNQPIYADEQPEKIYGTTEAMILELGQQVAAKTGLDLRHQIRQQMQMLWIWKADKSTDGRVKSFERGYETDQHPGYVKLRAGGGMPGVLSQLAQRNITLKASKQRQEPKVGR